MRHSLGEKYQLLQAMGISYWLERGSSTQLISTLPIFCAGCLVILPEPLSRLPEVEKKMLMSMLKVLECQAEHLCIAAVCNLRLLKPPFSDLLQREIQKWAPKSVLILGRGSSVELDCLDFGCCSMPIFLTYHPSELQNSPELKRKAYETLLSLKNTIKVIGVK